MSAVEPQLYGLGPVEAAPRALDRAGINVRVLDGRTLGVSMGENTTVQDVSDLLDAFNGGRAHGLDLASLGKGVEAHIEGSDGWTTDPFKALGIPRAPRSSRTLAETV